MMTNITQFMTNKQIAPSADVLQAFWQCDDQSLVEAIVKGLSHYEKWTFNPNDNAGFEGLSTKFKGISARWTKLETGEMSELVLVLSNLELGTAYFLMCYLEHHADSATSPVEALLSTALSMTSSNDPNFKQSGERLWSRLTTITKMVSAQGVIADALMQRIMCA